MSNQEADLELLDPPFVFGPFRYSKWVKRCVDVTLVVVSLPVTFPLIAALWLLVRTDGGRGFFGHERIGRDGRPFVCWKIRTMVPDAERILQEYLDTDQNLAREWAETYKLENDPRVTRVGGILRRTSLDELPQLWNVFRGDMSLVGPRPVPRDELETYADRQWAYKQMRPGLTGVWQVSGRGSCTYEERIDMDVEYVRTVSAMLDLKIIWKTFGTVLRKTGV